MLKQMGVGRKTMKGIYILCIFGEFFSLVQKFFVLWFERKYG